MQAARGSGHSSYVGAVAFSEAGIFSGSKDGVLKKWKTPDTDSVSGVQELHTLRTVLAHNQARILIFHQDQIGRIFVFRGIVFFGQFFENYRSSPRF
jgi:WD40 repeat protein